MRIVGTLDATLAIERDRRASAPARAEQTIAELRRDVARTLSAPVP